MEWLKKLSDAIDYIESNLDSICLMKKLLELPVARFSIFSEYFLM